MHNVPTRPECSYAFGVEMLRDSGGSAGPSAVRRIAIVSSASGSGKTTLGRALAQRLDVRFVELDALVHGPSWIETPDRELLCLVEPILATDGWVIDGTYQRKLGPLVLDAADIVVWLDLPLHVWLPRLLRRTVRRLRAREELWNGNRERFRTAFVGRDSLVVYALRMHVDRRRRYPAELAPYTVVRLRTPAEVEVFLSSARAP
jgi:adenylate kinase family enzyme